MAGVPPKAAEAYTLYFSVVSQADTNIFQANPTIAAGDFQYSLDGGTNFVNPGTLPSVVAGNNKVIQAPLTGGEMTPSVGDQILFAGSDQAGAEWQDITIIIATATQDMDDLSTFDETADNIAGSVGSVAAGGIAAASFAANAVDANALATDAAQEIADTTLGRNMATVAGAAGRSLLNAIRFLRNRWEIVAGTLTVYEEDDLTAAWTGAVTTAVSDPVDEINPT